MKKAIVLGSINYDIVSAVERLPVKGETVKSYSTDMFVGGKGSNQAVQISMLGMKVQFIGQVGNDDMGKTVKACLKEKGVDTDGLNVSDAFRTGCATIFVDPAGDNMLAYAPGANHGISFEQIKQSAGSVTNADIFITQNEINMDAMAKGLSAAKEAGVPTILNPAPAIPLDGEIYRLIDYITPNETEAEVYTGIPLGSLPFAEWKKQSAKWFLDRGVKAVCITLGNKGSYFSDGINEYDVSAFLVNAVDTTAAGDAFNGGFAYGVAHKMPIVRCIEIGNACGALAATVLGAQNSIHNIDQIRGFLSERSIEI